MACYYCQHFIHSKKRLGAKREDGSVDRDKPQRRLCGDKIILSILGAETIAMDHP